MNKSEQLAVTPDGSRIVSGSGNFVRIWDLESGVSVGEPLTGQSGWVTSVAVTPDGTLIVSGAGDSTIFIWDLATGGSAAGQRKQRAGAPVGKPLTGHVRGVTSVAITPDGSRIVSGSLDATIRIWDLAKGTPVGEPLTGHAGEVTAVAVTPDGRRIVSGSLDATIRIWDLANGTPVGEPLHRPCRRGHCGGGHAGWPPHRERR